jgi:hypothetical protein
VVRFRHVHDSPLPCSQFKHARAQRSNAQRMLLISIACTNAAKGTTAVATEHHHFRQALPLEEAKRQGGRLLRIRPLVGCRG